MKQNLKEILKNCHDRFDLWLNFANQHEVKTMTELGVYQGGFAEKMLKECPSIQKYYLLDPWRNLDNWNKPANKDNAKFEKVFQEAIAKTDFAKEKRMVLRGKTTEVIHEIPEKSLDFIYIDGDHTLKGITIDLLSVWGKVKDDGYIGGDDFSETIWQHEKHFEPTLVFPYAVYFAEAMNTKIYGLPFQQFLISKACDGFEFIDLTNGLYKNQSLVKQSLFRKSKKSIKGLFGSLKR